MKPQAAEQGDQMPHRVPTRPRNRVWPTLSASRPHYEWQVSDRLDQHQAVGRDQVPDVISGLPTSHCSLAVPACSLARSRLPQPVDSSAPAHYGDVKTKTPRPSQTQAMFVYLSREPSSPDSMPIA